MSRVYCFLHPESILWIYWYLREASIAVIVVNLPNCFQLLKKTAKIRELSYVRAATAAVASASRRATSRILPSRAASAGSRAAAAAAGTANGSPAPDGTKRDGGWPSRYYAHPPPAAPTDGAAIELKHLPVTTRVRRLDADGDADSTRAVLASAAGTPTSERGRHPAPSFPAAALARRSTAGTSSDGGEGAPPYPATPTAAAAAARPLEIAVHTDVEVRAEAAEPADWDARYGRPPTFDARGGRAGRAVTARAYAAGWPMAEENGRCDAV